MGLQSRVTFTMRNLDRLKCIQAVDDGDLKPGRAAERLGLTTRQVRRLVRRYAQEGPIGLTSRRFDHPSNNQLDRSLRRWVIRILHEQYADFGPTLAAEKLRTRHKVVLAKETVRQLQIASGLCIPRKLPPPKVQQPQSFNTASCRIGLVNPLSAPPKTVVLRTARWRRRLRTATHLFARRGQPGRADTPYAGA